MVEFWTEGTLLTPELCGHTLPLRPYLPWSWLALALPNKKTKLPPLGVWSHPPVMCHSS